MIRVLLGFIIRNSAKIPEQNKIILVRILSDQNSLGLIIETKKKGEDDE